MFGYKILLNADCVKTGDFCKSIIFQFYKIFSLNFSTFTLFIKDYSRIKYFVLTRFENALLGHGQSVFAQLMLFLGYTFFKLFHFNQMCSLKEKLGKNFQLGH